MLDPTYPLYPVAAFLGFLMAVIPLRWHLEAMNSGTCYFMFWTALACLNKFINSVVWADHARNVAPIWCEISIRITFCVSVGIPLAGLCISRRLYGIASVRAVTVTRAEKRRAVLVDSLICVLCPLLFAALQYIVQGHRFDLFENIGCHPAVWNTHLSFVISLLPPMATGLASAVYCVLSLRHFALRQQQFNEFLASSDSVTVSRYFRLMALSMSEIMCTVPLSVFVIIVNSKFAKVSHWVSWEDTHFNYGRIGQYPAAIWRMTPITVIGLELDRWLPVFCALAFFGFFGFAQEAVKNYVGMFWTAAGWFGLRRPQAKTAPIRSYGNPKGLASMPRMPHAPPPTHKHRTHSLTSSLAYSLDDVDLAVLAKDEDDIKRAPTPASPSASSPPLSEVGRTLESVTLPASPRESSLGSQTRSYPAEDAPPYDYDSSPHAL